MVYSLNQEQMRAAKEMGKHVRVELEKDIGKGQVLVKFIARDESGHAQVPNLLNGIAEQLCSLLYTYLGVESKIIELE